MIAGLQITMRGEELKQRVVERIREHESTMSALDARIKQREGDQPFDVRAEDGFKTLGELENERRHYKDRVSQLALLCNNVVVEEIYALNRADLRLAELISPDLAEVVGITKETVDTAAISVIDGLKLTLSGRELQEMLGQRMQDYQRRVDWFRREQVRTPEQQSEEEPLLPDHMCANEAERHEWHTEVLGFIRDHVEATAMYRLGEADLMFGELLPEKPDWMEQQAFEERTDVAFHLERLAKNVDRLSSAGYALMEKRGDRDE